jgi:anti-anti-sigma factor
MELKLFKNLPTLQPQGRLDAQNGVTLQLQIAMMLLKAPKLCVIDMAYVDNIDSAGLKFLVDALAAASEQQCRLALCNLQPQIRILMEISQLDRVFDIFESVEGILTQEVLPPAAQHAPELMAS